MRLFSRALPLIGYFMDQCCVLFGRGRVGAVGRT